MHGRTDDGRKVITIAHPEHSSGELKMVSTPRSFSSDRSKPFLFLQFFFVCVSVISHVTFVCHYLFLISPSFGASGELCFVIWHVLNIFTYVLFINKLSFWCDFRYINFHCGPRLRPFLATSILHTCEYHLYTSLITETNI